MKTSLSLIPIEPDGVSRAYSGSLAEIARQVVRATSERYTAVGFEEPWIGYLAMADEAVVGTCGFKTPPRGGRVELAYFTFPEFEGRGYASAMAAKLLSLSGQHDPSILVAAQTLPERNASHRVLEKLGFRHVATIDHAEDGTVWEWQQGQDQAESTEEN